VSTGTSGRTDFCTCNAHSAFEECVRRSTTCRIEDNSDRAGRKVQNNIPKPYTSRRSTKFLPADVGILRKRGSALVADLPMAESILLSVPIHPQPLQSTKHKGGVEVMTAEEGYGGAQWLRQQ
jgi:hypothetical protein